MSYAQVHQPIRFQVLRGSIGKKCPQMNPADPPPFDCENASTSLPVNIPDSPCH